MQNLLPGHEAIVREISVLCNVPLGPWIEIMCAWFLRVVETALFPLPCCAEHGFGSWPVTGMVSGTDSPRDCIFEGEK